MQTTLGCTTAIPRIMRCIIKDFYDFSSEPSDFLLVADCLAGLVRLVRSDRRDNNTYLVARSSCPTAVAFDPVDRRVVWSDRREKAIYSVVLDGSGRRTLLGAADGIDVVKGKRHCTRPGKHFNKIKLSYGKFTLKQNPLLK